MLRTPSRPSSWLLRCPLAPPLRLPLRRFSLPRWLPRLPSPRPSPRLPIPSRRSTTSAWTIWTSICFNLRGKRFADERHRPSDGAFFHVEGRERSMSWPGVLCLPKGGARSIAPSPLPLGIMEPMTLHEERRRRDAYGQVWRQVGRRWPQRRVLRRRQIFGRLLRGRRSRQERSFGRPPLRRIRGRFRRAALAWPALLRWR